MSYLVGVTMRISQNSTYYELRDCISSDYIEFFNEYNIRPVLISNNIKDPIGYFKELGCKALILTGGEDILIKQRDIVCKNTKFESNRDKTEYAILDYCVKNEIPILGICRGMQFINIYFQGEMYKLDDVKSNLKHVNINHYVDIISSEFIFNGINKVKVNSYHNNVIAKSGLSKELSVFAIAEENIVEGIYIKNKIIGLQWHPERNKSKIDEFIIKRWLSWIE